MIQLYTELGRGGFQWSRESRLQPALYFFYKVLGNVKGMLYLCIVMMMKLIDSPTHIKRLNKIMKNKIVTCGVKFLFTMRPFRVTTLSMLTRGTIIQPPIYTLSLISLSVYLKDNMVTMELTPSIGVIVELGPLTILLDQYSPMMVVRYSLNTLGLNNMNLVRLRLFGPLVNIFIRH
jgi:hypothetical protein